ncbi:serine hydroxymethyltransferase [Streptomyces regensis]|nr:serine hydroxymethyltransferase [Streptomyces regensis]
MNSSTNDVFDDPLSAVDPEVSTAVAAELDRQQSTLEMIASENFAPQAVLQAQGSVLTNKYAEGYPGKRYYGGCEHVDVVEQLAIDRAKDLFGADYANVQPHSGAQANAAAMFALLQPGDTIMGLHLAHGGHLTHGMRINFSGKLYNVVPYSVRSDTHRVDMDEVARLARETRPQLIIAGWSAYPRHLDFARFREIADEEAVAFKIAASADFVDRQRRTVEGARILAERLQADDARRAGVRLVSGGTDVHLVLVDLRESELDGKQAEDRLHEIGITVNRNAVPDDPRPPMVTSGLRIGTPALATRGFGAAEFTEVADILVEALCPAFDEATSVRLRSRVDTLASKHPLYPNVNGGF